MYEANLSIVVLNQQHWKIPTCCRCRRIHLLLASHVANFQFRKFIRPHWFYSTHIYSQGNLMNMTIITILFVNQVFYGVNHWLKVLRIILPVSCDTICLHQICQMQKIISKYFCFCAPSIANKNVTSNIRAHFMIFILSCWLIKFNLHYKIVT